MKRQGSSTGRKPKKASITIGRTRFEKISAVEGIVLTGAMKGRAADFERDGLSAAERRRSIIRAHRKG
jgi:hypothetical protein